MEWIKCDEDIKLEYCEINDITKKNMEALLGDKNGSEEVGIVCFFRIIGEDDLFLCDCIHSMIYCYSCDLEKNKGKNYISFGCLEKKSVIEYLPTFRLYYIGKFKTSVLMDDEYYLKRNVPIGFKIHGYELKKDAVLFFPIYSKECTQVNTLILRDKPLTWVYVFNFDPPQQNDLAFLNSFDLLNECKKRLFVLYKISSSTWSRKEQLLNLPLDMRFDWMRDRLCMHFLILIFQNENLKNIFDWYINAEKLVLNNNLLEAKSYEDKLQILDLNQIKSKRFDANEILGHQKKRMELVVNHIQKKNQDETHAIKFNALITSQLNDVWKETIDRHNDSNKPDEGWKRVKHIKKTLPNKFKEPEELDEGDYKLFDLDYIIKLVD